MKIAICDEDAVSRQLLLEYAREYTNPPPNFQSQEITFTAFAHAEDLLDNAGRLGGYDVYILEIPMDGMNGIELGVRLRQAGCDGRIIFLTSCAEYALDSFRARPFNYLLKPLSRKKFFSALDEVLDAASPRDERNVIVRTREGSVRLNFTSILYAELNRRAVIYHLPNGKTVESVQIRTTFSEAVRELLREDCFILCGASIAVNLQHIVRVEKNVLLFRDGSRMYLPRKSCSELRAAWQQFWQSGEISP